MQLTGKVALVTGGTKGIGAATAIMLAKGGADVAINGRYDDPSAAAVRDAISEMGRRCFLTIGDMAKAEDASRCVLEAEEKLGALDVLVHSAGGAVTGALLDVTPEAWYEAFDVHVHAVFHLGRAAIPMMQRRGGGALVLVSSVAGIRGVPFNLPYQAVKGALPQLTRALARMHADDGIRVDCVAPGIIRTRFHETMTPEQKQHNLDNRIPLHTEGTPEQVADLIVQLATNDYITGETVTIDGGLTMRIA